jgi:hypothetical protein
MIENNTIKLMWNVILSILLFMSITTYAQNDNNNPAPSGSPGEENTTVSEEAIGYWELNTSNSTSNPTKITKWNGSQQSLTGTAEWKDILDIIHTVSSSFKWDAPPERMVPGMELNLSSSYVDNEYSTTGKTKTGIKIYIDKVGNPIEKPSYESIDIVKLNKDYREHRSENRDGKFSAPKFFKGRSKDIQVIVDCFIGDDHYVTTYVYDWVNSQ